MLPGCCFCNCISKHNLKSIHFWYDRGMFMDKGQESYQSIMIRVCYTFNLLWRSGNQIHCWDRYPTPLYPLKELVSSITSVRMATHHSRTQTSNYFWNKENKFLFSVYKKKKLVRYLNLDSHHHQHHKAAVLAGVELRLALLTTRTPINAKMSNSNIYPDKQDALQLTGQIQPGHKMQALKVCP
jgi:hypothetical protein